MSGEETSGNEPVVTIDGPAGSGKSTTAKEVARRIGFRHLDSGALYRALTLAVDRTGVDPVDWAGLGDEFFAGLDVSLVPGDSGFQVLIDGERPGGTLRSARTTELAPLLASNPSARARLLSLQRSALEFGGVVADGRDMGTVVFPRAALKVYLVAALEERARRRVVQEGRDADASEVAREAERIGQRDQADSSRTVAPLRRAPDALLIDTTQLPFEVQVEQIVRAAAGLTRRGGEE